MGIEALETLVTPKRVPLVKSALYSIAAIFCVVILIYGWPLAMRNAAQVAPASGIPMIYPLSGAAGRRLPDAGPDRADLAVGLRAEGDQTGGGDVATPASDRERGVQ